jgi:hypothetical protein
VPNSVILVMDPNFGVPPKSMDGVLISATDTCIAIGTIPEQDGEATIVLSDDPTSITSSGTLLVFDGLVRTPARTIAVSSVLDERLLEMRVGEGVTRIRVWASHELWPNRITILAG